MRDDSTAQVNIFDMLQSKIITTMQLWSFLNVTCSQSHEGVMPYYGFSFLKLTDMFISHEHFHVHNFKLHFALAVLCLLH